MCYGEKYRINIYFTGAKNDERFKSFLRDKSDKDSAPLLACIQNPLGISFFVSINSVHNKLKCWKFLESNNLFWTVIKVGHAKWSKNKWTCVEYSSYSIQFKLLAIQIPFCHIKLNWIVADFSTNVDFCDFIWKHLCLALMKLNNERDFSLLNVANICLQHQT